MKQQHPSIPILELSPEIESHWEEILIAIQDVIRSGHFVLGPEVRLFEEEVASFLGVRHSVGVNSGTDALIIGLSALGITQGDEVITTPFSFVATAEAICQVGAKPVFADIDPLTFNIDPKSIEEKVTSRTKGIIPVHLYGRPVDMDSINAIAKRCRIFTIEDCAQAFGAQYSDSTQVGSKGDLAAFSFYPTKNLGSYGDAGMIVTPHDWLKDKLRMLRVHGEKTRYDSSLLGYNSRLDSIQAAILRVKLKYVSDKNRSRFNAALRYRELLANISEIHLPETVDGHAFHQFTVRVKNGKRDRLRDELLQRGIHSIVYYPTPVNLLAPYMDLGDPCPHSVQACHEVLSLPMGPSIEHSTQKTVASAIKEILPRI